MVLVKCILEGGAGGRTRGLLARTGADSGSTHEIILVTELLVALLVESPVAQAEDTDEDGTANTDHDTNDDLLVR